MSPRPASHGARAERTRRAILGAAEAIFAERGFAATRLEDVAERVGIRRASIVYYFKNKRALYEAVLESVFSGLEERIEAVLSGPEELPQRIEGCVSAWVEYVGTRPSFARLLLREVADGGSRDRRAVLRRFTRPFFGLIQKHVVERPDPAARAMRDVDPVHIASTIAGGSVFFAAAIPALVPEIGLDPASPQQIQAQREQALRILPLLLEAGSPARPKAAQRAEGERSRTARPKAAQRAEGERSRTARPKAAQRAEGERRKKAGAKRSPSTRAGKKSPRR